MREAVPELSDESLQKQDLRRSFSEESSTDDLSVADEIQPVDMLEASVFDSLETNKIEEQKRENRSACAAAQLISE